MGSMKLKHAPYCESAQINVIALFCHGNGKWQQQSYGNLFNITNPFVLVNCWVFFSEVLYSWCYIATMYALSQFVLWILHPLLVFQDFQSRVGFTLSERTVTRQHRPLLGDVKFNFHIFCAVGGRVNRKKEDMEYIWPIEFILNGCIWMFLPQHICHAYGCQCTPIAQQSPVFRRWNIRYAYFWIAKWRARSKMKSEMFWWDFSVEPKWHHCAHVNWVCEIDFDWFKWWMWCAMFDGDQQREVV